jgi:hypothetical protein
MVYNAILRNAPEELFAVFEKAGNLFSTTIHVLQSAVVKVARNVKIPDGLVLYRGLAVQFPEQFHKADVNGCKGFAEWGFMSTTTNREIAVMYSGVREGKPRATVLQIKTSSVNRAACIEMYSQYSQEREYLWVPLSYMQPEGGQVVEASQHGVLHSIDVNVSANGTAATTEDLLSKKKQLHIKGFEIILEDLKVEFFRTIHYYVNKEEMVKPVVDHILTDIQKVLEQHRQIDAGKYTDADLFKGLNEQMLETVKFGRSKLTFILDGKVVIQTAMEWPLRTCQRLLVADRRKKFLNSQHAKQSAQELCQLIGLVRSSVHETNEIGESRLIQAAADDAGPSALRLLVKAGANVNAATPEGFTAVFRAAQYGNADCLKVLIEARADANLAHKIGRTPLFVAAQNQHPACVRMLIQARVSIDAAGEDGATALHTACQGSHHDCVELLLNAGANVNLRKKNGATPIFLAAFHFSLECIQLLKAAGADLSIRCEGMTPLEIVQREDGYRKRACLEALQIAAPVSVSAGGLERTPGRGAGRRRARGRGQRSAANQAAEPLLAASAAAAMSSAGAAR